MLSWLIQKWEGFNELEVMGLQLNDVTTLING
jgi:hypothetical protein